MRRTIANVDLTESDLPPVNAELDGMLKFGATFDWTSYFGDIREARRAAQVLRGGGPTRRADRLSYAGQP